MRFPYPFSMFEQVWPLITFFILVDVVLRGLALWRAGRNNHPVWFVFLLIVNSLGILPLIYLVFFQKKNPVQ